MGLEKLSWDWFMSSFRRVALLRFLVRVSLRLKIAVGVLGRSSSSDSRLLDLDAKGSMLRKDGLLEVVLPRVMVLDREKLKKEDEAVDATELLL